MTGRIDLGVELADYRGTPPPPRPGPSSIFTSTPPSPDPVPLGQAMADVIVTGPPGPPTDWQILPPAPDPVAYAELLAAGPPPVLNIDADGIWFADPHSGVRIDVVLPTACQVCGAHLEAIVVNAADRRILCPACREVSR